VNTTDQLCRRLAKDGKMAVVSVDYRLCPEVTYPAHLDDVEAAYQWLLTQPDMDGTRLVVAGDSAGGQLVAALQTRLHQRNQPTHLRPRAQALIYPALDMSCNSPSYTRFAEGYGLSREAMQNFIRLYLGGDTRLHSAPEVSPLNLTDVGFFPPTLALLAEADPLRDDCHRFVAKLQTAGVRTHEVVYPRTVHAFITHFDVFPESAMAVAEMVAFFHKVLGK
jgi:acetyl esterase